MLLPCLYGLCCYPQDTIEVGKNSKVTLYFEQKMEQVTIGNDQDFFYTESDDYRSLSLFYNRKSKKMEDRTNLTVMTQDKKVYGFLLSLVEWPSNFNIRVSKGDELFSLGDPTQKRDTFIAGTKDVKTPLHYYSNTKSYGTRGIEKDSVTEVATPELYLVDRAEYFRRKIYYNPYDKRELLRYYTRNGRVALWLENVKYNNNELYIFLRLENRESLDYDVSTIHYAISTIKNKANSFQKNDMPPIYTYNVPKRIEGRGEAYFALVFEKFSLDQKKALVIDIDEFNGDRNLRLKIDSDIIKNPIRF